MSSHPNHHHGKEHHDHKDGINRSSSATLEKMKLEMRRRSHTFQAFSKSSRSLSDKQERDAMIAHKNEMMTQTYLDYDDITLYYRIMKPALMFIDDIFDIFQRKRLNPHESEKILNFLVEELKSAQTEGGFLVASRITEHLLSEKNPFHDTHMKDFLAFTTGVKAVLQRLKKSRTPNSTIMLYLLNIVYYVAQLDDGKIMLYKEGALDKIILLLYREKEDVLEYMQVKILVSFYKEEFYRRAIDLKSAATSLQSLSNDEEIISHEVKRHALPLKKTEQKDTGVPHQMVKVHFNKPTFCKYCTEFIWGLGKQGYTCRLCGYSSHKRCHDKILATCTAAPTLDSRRSTLRQLGLRNSIDTLSTDSLRDSRDYELNLHGKLIKWACTGKIPIHHEIQQTDIAIERCIYQSPLCEVYKAVYLKKPSNGNTIVAVKKFDTNSIAFTWEDFRKEIALLTVVTNSKVVKFLGANTTAQQPFIVFEFFIRGSLKSVFEDFRKKNFKPSLYQITLLAIDMCTALDFLHKRNIIHRDLKPANFLVGDHYEIKVTDFGASRVMISPDLKMTKVGTPVWMAPEIQRNEVYTEKADVYSFSLVLYELVTLQVPFQNISHLELHSHVVLKKERPSIPSDCPTDVAQLIESCWHDIPNKRPSFATILDILYNITDPSTGHKVMEHHARVAEVVLAQLCPYLELTDLYSASQVCRSWYSVIAQALLSIGLRVGTPKMPVLQEWHRNLNLSRSPQMSIIGASRKRSDSNDNASKTSSESSSSSEYSTEASKPEETKADDQFAEKARAVRMKSIQQALFNTTESDKQRMLSSALGKAFKNMKKQHESLSKKAIDMQLQDLKIMLDTQKMLAEEAAKFKKKLLSRKVNLQASDDTNEFFIAEENTE